MIKKEQISESEKEKERDIQKGIEFIGKKQPFVAKEFFKKAGLSEEEAELKLAEFLEEKKKEEQDQKPKKERELSLEEEIKLKELGLTFVAKNQKIAAEACFRGAKLSNKEIELLLNTKPLSIEKEKKEPESILEDRKYLQNLLKLGKECLDRNDFHGARIFFRESGFFSKDKLESLYKAELKEKEKKKRDLTSEQKIAQKKTSEEIKNYYRSLLADSKMEFSDDFRESLKKVIEEKEE